MDIIDSDMNLVTQGAFNQLVARRNYLEEEVAQLRSERKRLLQVNVAALALSAEVEQHRGWCEPLAPSLFEANQKFLDRARISLEELREQQ